MKKNKSHFVFLPLGSPNPLFSLPFRFLVSLSAANLLAAWLLLPLVLADMFVNAGPSQDAQGALQEGGALGEEGPLSEGPLGAPGGPWVPGGSCVLCRALDVVSELVAAGSVFATLLVAVRRRRGTVLDFIESVKKIKL